MASIKVNLLASIPKYNMKTIYLLILICSLTIISKAQKGPINILDSSLATAGISGIASADLDNDGRKEVITSTTGNAGRIGYYKNQTNNTFSTFTLIAPFASCRGFAVGDFNNDNWKDIVAIGGINNDSKIYSNNSGTFSPGVTLDSNNMTMLNDVVVADFDGNNSDDIVIIGQHSIDLYRNNGSGNFTKEIILSTSTSPKVLECLDLATADMDGDGDMDLICGETAGLVIYINNGNAIFTPHYYSIQSEIVSLVHPFDINNDGKIDVVGKNSANEVKWFSNDGSGVMTFEAILTNIPILKSLASIDYNNDGFEDIYASYPNNVAIFKNDSSHNFNTEITVYQDNALIMGAVQIVDIDNQNGLDYCWSGGTNTIAYHINQSPLSITDIKANSLAAYPNPTSGIINFTRPIKKLVLYNLLGKKCIESYNTHEINLEAFPAGIYVLTVEDENNLFYQKVIKE